MIVDVATFIGAYPFRHLDHADRNALEDRMATCGVDEAWVGYLPVFLHRDPRPANDILYRDLEGSSGLRVVPAVDAGLPDWRRDVDQASDAGAVAVRVYPMHQGTPADGDDVTAAVSYCGESQLPVILTVRFEDMRQRHSLDIAGDLPAAAVRHLARHCPTQIIVTHASREFIEEVHFGLTPDEAERVSYDISWLWGPPADDLDILTETIGSDRFLFGSGYPLRLMEAPVAKLDVSRLNDDDRRKIESVSVRKLEERARSSRPA